MALRALAVALGPRIRAACGCSSSPWPLRRFPTKHKEETKEEEKEDRWEKLLGQKEEGEKVDQPLEGERGREGGGGEREAEGHMGAEGSGKEASMKARDGQEGAGEEEIMDEEHVTGHPGEAGGASTSSESRAFASARFTSSMEQE